MLPMNGTGHNGTNGSGPLPKPLPGKCLLELKHSRAESIGGIFIPETSRGYSRIGKLVAMTPYQSRSQVWVGHKRRWISTDQLNAEALGCLEKMVSASDGVEFRYGEKDFFLVRLEHVLAIVPEKTDVAESDEDVLRCRHCRTEGEGNIMLHVNGHCPKCGRDKNGKREEQWKSKMVR